jgi:hypothetical protein
MAPASLPCLSTTTPWLSLQPANPTGAPPMTHGETNALIEESVT